MLLRSKAASSLKSRSLSTLTKRPGNGSSRSDNSNKRRALQYRTFFGSISRNLLAHLEQTANKNPQSATAQNAFYSALLRANLSDVVVERYQSGRYGSNAACESTYLRALERMGQAEHAPTFSSQPSAPVQQLGNSQLQAVGQAVGAHVHGSNSPLTKQGVGARDSPLYVVVDESRKTTVFKWFRFIVKYAFLAYICLVSVTFLIDFTGLLKRVGGTHNTEVRPEAQKTRFSDVHGCDEAKEELQELVEFLKAPDKFSSLGGKLPKGVLLVGPPGTGKTLLARAVAGEAGVPFFYMSGSEFDEVYVGVGAKRVRELFSAARAKAPAIIFIDELDAIGGKRNERDAAFARHTLNQLLTDLDGFDQDTGIVIIAATNFPKLLDKALTRPGRFDRHVTVDLPDVRGRLAILKYHMKNIHTGTDVDPSLIARGTPGLSGAELENVVNQAAVRASKLKRKRVTNEDFEWAKDKVLMGSERRSAVIPMKEKEMTAYHEGGHALVAMFNKHATPLYKATILPRGQALGITFQLPEIDKHSQSKEELLAKIDVCMAGKVAEELIYGPDATTSGAESDLQKATSIAFAMITRMGMSDEIGNVDFYSNYSRLSSDMKMNIEKEVQRVLEGGRRRATELLKERRKELDLLAKALIENETLNRDEMEKAVRGENLPDKLKTPPSLPAEIEDIGQHSAGTSSSVPPQGTGAPSPNATSP